MTRADIRFRIRRNLDDLGITYYTAVDINEAIQDAYDEVVVYCECIEKRVDLDFVSNTTYYDFSTLIPDYYRVIKLYHNGQNRFIDPTNNRNQGSYRIDWEVVNATEREYVILGPKYVGMSGRQAIATGNFGVFYKAKANQLIDTSIPLISDNYIRLLELYGTADLLEQNQEFTKAIKYWQEYDPMLEDYRRKVQLLAKADRVFTREI